MGSHKAKLEDAGKEADALIAAETVKALSKEGILIEDDVPYSHNSTYGGRRGAFYQKRIKSGSIWKPLVIFIVIILVIELIERVF